ncbi:MAG TPA: hypothetical protein VF516_24260 [Kofleriaceae bacterium]
MLSQNTPSQITQAAEDSMASDGCSSAVLDLAAFSEGNLSDEGLRRLAGHLQQCSPCKALFASLAKDAESALRAGGHDVMSGIAIGNGNHPASPVRTNSGE